MFASPPLLRALATAALLTVTLGAVHAQSLPTKPYRIVVPFTAGSQTEVYGLHDGLLRDIGPTVAAPNEVVPRYRNALADLSRPASAA